MRNVLQVSFLFLAIGLLLSFSSNPQPPLSESKIKWYSWEEAVAANQNTPKKFYVDIYTDWCGWCKVMDKKTFSNPEIADYINQNFYPVKLNAEQKEDISFNGKTYSWHEENGKGIHLMAYSLLDGKMSYPSFVYLNSKFERIHIAPGFKKPEQLLPELKFVGDGHYKNQTWEEYLKE